ncbi:MAG: RHS repeat-associated core domain-containing protein, partial [Kiritimatiellae bacterium]|nr:RHS repeat-associated core domain-containing protein [Kiritimatiellia bacterium]
ADGNMTGDGTFAYAYDAENRLVSVTSAAETNGAIRVLNAYDHRNRRIRKTAQRLNSSIAPPPSPPVGIHEWETQETHTFVWDGNNIVLEKVEFADGTTRTFEYFWGADKSGSEQGAGGVEGLLAVSMDGVFYIPCYDHNGNIILYVSETGSIAAQYVYDPYGNVVESYGDLAGVFHFGFSTQYYDRETALVSYLMRFYNPPYGRWLNRDPIEEDGGENLYAFCKNNPLFWLDSNGNFVLPIIIDPNQEQPPGTQIDPSPDIFDHFGNGTEPLGEEKWFEKNYAGWLAEARRRFIREINSSIDCKMVKFYGPSGRINIYPSPDRGGGTARRTPGGNEQEFGDAGQSDWSADKILGSFSIDYETPVIIEYRCGKDGKKRYYWTTNMYVDDVLGTQEGDLIRKIPGIASITPSRRVKRASWPISGSGECHGRK